MADWLRRHGLLDVERSDWMRTPGRTATLLLGPFAFHLETADGLALAFGVTVGHWFFGWHTERNEG